MALARGVAALALFLLAPVASAVAEGAQIKEASDFFSASGADLDAQGWKAFLDTSSHSAHSKKDRLRQESIDEAIAEARLIDVPINTIFAEKVQESAGTPTLRQLAAQHWNGLHQPAKSEASSGAPRNLRSILVNAGRK